MFYSYILFIFYLCVSCASQEVPSGGPIDKDGPQLLNIYPIKDLLNVDEDIVLFFDELIDPFSVFDAIEIYHPVFDSNNYFIGNTIFHDFDYKVKGRKIIISPFKTWPLENIIKLHISKEINDFQKNQMKSPIQLSYILNKDFNTDYTKSYISGQIINSDQKSYEVGLLSIKDISNIKLLEKVETDNNGTFIFSDLNSGKYSILAILDYIEEPSIDIRRRNYGMIPFDSIVVSNLDTITNLDIFVDSPIERLSIQSVRPVNNYFGYILYNNGQEEPFIFPIHDPVSKLTYTVGDTILIEKKLKNRLESYDLPPYEFVISNILDTIPPTINSYDITEDFLHIEFDEPIIAIIDDNKIDDFRVSNKPIIMDYNDSIIHLIPFSFIDPFTIEVEKDQIVSDRILVYNISDLSYNLNRDTSYIDIVIPDINNSYVGGNIYGILDYNGDNSVIIKATNITTNNSYYFVTGNKKFSFINLEVGMYMIFAYERLGEIESNEYFSGTLIPLMRSAKFGRYHSIIEVRSHWDVQDLLITIK